ncbi:MAG: hypothetical protein A2521_13000 [Deltaproteobacteria bacterium RIFOXYD12_FULL_57_12]|nr:MAG: hypothetical protein A2521_13000 [Deltaproteobacteria bacterium RIFOXYD12_FULL_57_12]
MQSALPIDKMTVSDKLQLMELLWDDLCRTPEQVPSPGWHEKILQERAKRTTEGTAKFSNWSEAKENIRNSVK